MSAPRSLPRRVLAVGAHPDDIELGCAGTLARFLESGSEVFLAVVCQGNRGGAPTPDGALATRRRREAETSAALLGASIEFLGFGDGEVDDLAANRSPFVRLLRRVRPDLVITHPDDDYHADHVAVARLVAASTWFAASPGLETPEPPLERTPVLFAMESLAGMGPEPTHLVDVTTTFPLKRAMLACHCSQIRRADSGISRLEELAESLGKLRGLQCGVTHAEGFRPAFLWGRRGPEPIFP